jgi:hypothetical protein
LPAGGWPPARRSPRMRTLWRNAHLTTLAEASGWGFIRRGALVVDDRADPLGRLDADLPAGLTVDAEHHPRRRAGHAGPVDCHTHLVYGGQRAREFELASRARATRTSPTPAAASVPPSRRPAAPATAPCSTPPGSGPWR